jgi:hypothetical protein
LQRLAEQELGDLERRRHQEVKRLMMEIESTFSADEPTFDAAKLIREDRETH